MYVCMYVCMYAYLYIFISLHIHINIYIYTLFTGGAIVFTSAAGSLDPRTVCSSHR